jgi:hypothetical protein
LQIFPYRKTVERSFRHSPNNFFLHDIQGDRAGVFIQKYYQTDRVLAKHGEIRRITLARVLRLHKRKIFWRLLMRIARIATVIFFAAILALVIVAPASIQAQGTSSQAAGVDDGQLKSFAKVYVQIEKIRETYGPQLKETQDPQKGTEIQLEAKSKIDEALAKEGMTAETYSQTVQIVSADNALRTKAIELITQERNKP